SPGHAPPRRKLVSPWISSTYSNVTGAPESRVLFAGRKRRRCYAISGYVASVHTPAARTLRRHCATSAVALPARHQVDELVEQVQRVVRARGGLRVVLDAEHGQLPVLQPLHRLVVQVDVRHAEGGRAQYAVLTVPPDGEAMVLRRDLDRAVA